MSDICASDQEDQASPVSPAAKMSYSLRRSLISMGCRYGPVSSDETKHLKAEVAKLRAALHKATSLPGPSGMSHPNVTNPSPSRGRPFLDRPTAHAMPSIPESGTVIRHLGRLVSSAGGETLFAGSTTGVHFMQAVDQKYQQLTCSTDRFPDSLFRLHLLPHPVSAMSTPARPGMYTLPLAAEVYMNRVDHFLSRWNDYFPILCRLQAMDRFRAVLASRQSDGLIASSNSASAYQLLLILAIESWYGNETEPTTTSEDYYYAARQLDSQLSTELSLDTIQSQLLSFIYFQLSGKHALLLQAVGAATRAAQALGLHRNPHRFNLCIGEQELRIRLWWCICVVETTSAIAYGLPKLVCESDVDVALPTACVLDDSTTTSLTMGLPGESPNVVWFVQLCKLTSIMKHMTQLLFTTTQRRAGEQKIKVLDRQLQVWSYDWLGGQARLHDRDNFFGAYSRLLAHSCMLLIHQPALTFPETEPQFGRSLKSSAESALAIISTLTASHQQKIIFYLQPYASRLIFQSALVCFYYSWHHLSLELPARSMLLADDDESISAQPTLKSAIESAVTLMRNMQQDWPQHTSDQFGDEKRDSKHILQIAILRLDAMLQSTMAMLDTGHRDDDNLRLHEMEQFQGWSNSLWDMNAAEFSEWTEGLTLDPFAALDFALESADSNRWTAGDKS